MESIEYIGAILGILGSLFVTSKDRKRRFIAFNMWIASNAFLMTLYISLGRTGLIIMCSWYTATSLLGWWNNRKD